MTLKSDLIIKAQSLGLKTDKLTIAQLKEIIAEAEAKNKEVQPTKEEVKADSVDQGAEAEVKTDDTDENLETKDETSFAKAGKRSRKSITEKQAEADRQARKQEAETDAEVKPKKAVKPPRPIAERRSKKYKEIIKAVDFKKVYDVDQAFEIILKTSTTKFDSSVEILVALGVDPKKANQNIRDFVVLPNGSGKKLRIAAYIDDDQVEAALKAGVAVAGKEVFLQQLDKAQIDFDVLITMPHLMASLSKYAKLLGPKGLMPSPKAGTITKDVLKTIKEINQGRLEYKVDENGQIHASIGKISFGSTKLKNNFYTVFESLKTNKPNNFKGTYVKNIYLSTTMGPSIKMNIPN